MSCRQDPEGEQHTLTFCAPADSESLGGQSGSRPIQRQLTRSPEQQLLPAWEIQGAWLSLKDNLK